MMKELISKEKMCRAIKDHLIGLLDKGITEVEVTEFNVDILNIIEALPEEYHWNPITESVPSDDRYILLSFECFALPMVGRYEQTEEGGAFYAGDEEETLASQDLFVNAWMELPKAYGED